MTSVRVSLLTALAAAHGGCEGAGAARSSHHGLDLTGAFVDLSLDGDQYSVSRDDTVLTEGDRTVATTLGTGSSWEIADGVMVDLPGHLLALSRAAEGPDALTLTVPRGKDVDQLRPIVDGNYTWVRLRSGAGTGADWGFLTVDGDRIHYAARPGTDSEIDTLPYGVNILTDENADRSGTLQWSEDDPQVVVVEEDDGGRWGGVVDPGWTFVLQAPDGDGILLAVLCPQSHAQLTTWDGFHDGIELRADDGGAFSARGPVVFDFYSREGNLERRTDEGEVREWALGNRIPVFTVGNLAHWDFTVPEDESAVSERFFVVHWDGVTVWFSTTLASPGAPQGPADLLAFGVGVQP